MHLRAMRESSKYFFGSYMNAINVKSGFLFFLITRNAFNEYVTRKFLKNFVYDE
jgi:hypothetical protein